MSPVDVGRTASGRDGRAGQAIRRERVRHPRPYTRPQARREGAGGKPIAFHQDGPYLEFLDPWDTYLTCWIALADTTEDMGPITYIRGSHRWRESAKPSKFGTGDEEDMMEV